jgi:hypothetical protein
VPGPAGQWPGLRIRTQRAAVGGGVRANGCFPSGFSFLFLANYFSGMAESARARQVPNVPSRFFNSEHSEKRRDALQHDAAILSSKHKPGRVE